MPRSRSILPPRLYALWHELCGSFWFVPGLMAVGAVALAVTTLLIDRTISFEKVPEMLRWLFTGSPGGVRDLLATTAGSVITALSVVFSITIVALTLAAAQLGPRLLRTFMGDRGNQVVLGAFVGTFLYCLLVLQQVDDTEAYTFIPYISSVVAMALTLLVAALLIYFIHHTAASIQADHVVGRVSAGLGRAIDRFAGEPHGVGGAVANEATLDDARRRLEGQVTAVRCSKEGYIQTIDYDLLVRAASEHDSPMRLRYRPGHFIIRDSIVLEVAGTFDEDGGPFRDPVHRAFVVGGQRTDAQDVEYAVRELVEVALRALSPGINDPFTAINCIDRLGAGLARMASKDQPDPWRCDELGVIRLLLLSQSDFQGLADAALHQLRQTARVHPAVMIHMLAMIAAVAAHLRTDGQRAIMQGHAELILRAALRHTEDAHDRADLNRQHEAAREALGF